MCVCVRESVCVFACVDGVKKEKRKKGFPPMCHFSHFTPSRIVYAEDGVNGLMILSLLLLLLLFAEAKRPTSLSFAIGLGDESAHIDAYAYT